MPDALRQPSRHDLSAFSTTTRISLFAAQLFVLFLVHSCAAPGGGGGGGGGSSGGGSTGGGEKRAEEEEEEGEGEGLWSGVYAEEAEF
ncbi:hypothetical protein ANTRET_LOCUS7325 [Anthophora retusa]